MATTSLVAEAHALSRKLSGILRVAGYNPINEEKDVADFLYQAWVLADLLEALRATWNVEFLPTDKPLKLARGPANLANYSHFKLDSATKTLRISFGTAVTDQYGYRERFPDIALLMNCDQPLHSASDVLAIWDTKLQGDTRAPVSSRIPQSAVDAVAGIVTQLAVPAPATVSELDAFPPAFATSALISNGCFPTDAPEFFICAGFGCVAQYTDVSTPTKPTRDEHRNASGGGSLTASSRPKGAERSSTEMLDDGSLASSGET